MALATKPRWDKYDAYVGNYRGTLADDIDLDTESNVVLAVGHNSDGDVVIGAGTSGIKGVMIVAVGIDIHGNLLDGGINTQSGDPCDVGKHGEITNFVPTLLGAEDSVSLAVTATGGTALLKVNGKPSAPLALPTNAAAIKTALVGIDDGFGNSDFTVLGTGPWQIYGNPDLGPITVDATAATGGTVTVTPAVADAEAGKSYYGHADGSVTSTKGSDGVYVGHTAEADRLIVNVLDSQ